MSNLIKRQQLQNESTPVKTIGIQRVFQHAEDLLEYENDNEQLLNIREELEEYQNKLELVKQEIEMQKRDAQLEIDQMKQLWFEEKNNLIQVAKEEGIALGKEEGRQIALYEYESLLNEAKEVVEASKVDYINRIEESEDAILKLGLAVSEHILLHEIDQNQEHLIPIVKKVLHEIREEKDIRLTIHPSQYDLLVTQRVELEKILLNESKLFIYPDETLSMGSCVIDSSFGRIDASVDVQLSEISRKLLELSQEEVDATN
ncbi:flagellar assembly protein FliH [Gottfriedia solisilvae]|uniref:Flagellar assembly protein FliH n=1 Tax=Gottfriedia solisilvae TaxID=1516104 RepID=A0A8J3F295_9BACI|nr:flagellar assembly protein FliH [Gottfriedia solisilvae]GGI14226.1 putative flagellar assembly protein FliH [Gottfriedia solisilvae]